MDGRTQAEELPALANPWQLGDLVNVSGFRRCDVLAVLSEQIWRGECIGYRPSLWITCSLVHL